MARRCCHNSTADGRAEDGNMAAAIKPFIHSFTSATTSSISSRTATFNPGQKRPSPSAGTQTNSVRHLQQILSANSYASIQHQSSSSSLFTLADATLLQNSAIVNEALKTLGTFQQQEIAAKRVRFGPAFAPLTPAFVPLNNNTNTSLTTYTPASTPAIVVASAAAASAATVAPPPTLTLNTNNNSNVQQQQIMAMSSPLCAAAVVAHQQQKHLAPPPLPPLEELEQKQATAEQQQQQQKLLCDTNGTNVVGINGTTTTNNSIITTNGSSSINNNHHHHHNHHNHNSSNNNGGGDGGDDQTTTTPTVVHAIGGTKQQELCGADYVRYDAVAAVEQHHHLDPNGAMALQCLDGSTNLSQSYQDLSAGVQAQPNSVLRIIIDYMLYPVTLDVLYLIFSRYGKVLRIITFNKNNLFQALIQLSEASSAQNAKNSLDGLNIYNGCCTLHIEYSKLNTLNVKWNNDKSRDYTNPNLPSGDLTYEQKLQLILQNVQASNGGLSAMIPLAATTPNQFPFSAIAMPQAANLAAPHNAAAVAQILPNNLASIMLNNVANNNSCPSAAAAQFQAAAGTPVVLVSNLDETAVTPEQLFLLFGVYGDVIRVKILFNKKNNALIQYADVQQAQLAIQHLDKVKWNGKNMRVTASKHIVVQMPKEGQPDAGLTKEYHNSSLHRFKKPGSKNYMNIYPPSSTLHLSNIPSGITEDAMLDIFQDFKIVEFKFFQKDHKMALLQLDDVESAIHFLVTMHNYKLAENAHLRVSFSKKGING